MDFFPVDLEFTPEFHASFSSDKYGHHVQYSLTLTCTSQMLSIMEEAELSAAAEADPNHRQQRLQNSRKNKH